MNEYPLSTISSKKVKKSSSSLFQRSACQATAPGLVNKAEYCHILKGERVFIELYYQGKVMETAYNEWIQFMGGILYKRLNPKVTIFLTNSDTQQLQSILDRTRRICPSCRVISILWFERCFQTKSKVSFEQFALDVESKAKSNENPKDKQQQEKIDLALLNGFITNITQDLEADFKDFFKNNKNKLFQYPPKNSTFEDKELMKAQEFDLGPNPHRKKEKQHDYQNRKRQKPKVDNDKRRRRTSIKKDQENVSLAIPSHGEVRQTKSLQNRRKQKYKQEELSQEQTKLSFEQEPMDKKEQGLSFNTMMEKYLSMREESRKSNRKHVQDQVQHAELKDRQKQLSSKRKQEQSDMLSVRVHSKHSLATQRGEKVKNDKILPYSFNKKHNYQKKNHNKPASNLQLELQQLGQKITSTKFNNLIVISDSKNLSAKIERVNQQRIDRNEIYLQNIYYHIYVNFLNQSPPQHIAYYLFNPRRVIDRPLYFALTCFNNNCPRLVSCKLIDQVEHHNRKIRSGAKDQQQARQGLNLRYLRQLTLNVNRGILRKKKIVFLQSEIPVDILQPIVKSLEAEWVSQNQYLMGRKPDIVATNRSSLPDNSFLTICEEDLWIKIFPFQNDRASS